MSNLVFGIYLFHVFFVHIIYNLNFMKEFFSFNSFSGLLILDLLVFLSSGIILTILRKCLLLINFYSFIKYKTLNFYGGFIE